MNEETLHTHVKEQITYKTNMAALYLFGIYLTTGTVIEIWNPDLSFTYFMLITFINVVACWLLAQLYLCNAWYNPELKESLIIATGGGTPG